MAAEAPFHIFIIPDGNRRWARPQTLQPHEGHQQGYVALKSIMESIWDFGVTHFTFWALSQDNIQKRPENEVAALFALLGAGVNELQKSKTFLDRKIRFRAAGDWKSMLPSRLSYLIENLEQSTQKHIGPTFTLLLAYDGVEEMHDAFERDRCRPSFSCREGPRDRLRQHIASGFLPDVDLMIRTGGEPHLSGGALMLQMKNAHIYFTKTLWPDFSTGELAKAIGEFKTRERRLGS